MKHRKVLSALLALVMVMALAVPALAAPVDSINHLPDDFGGDDWFYIVHLELDRDPVATALPWTYGYDLSTIYVPVGTMIQSLSKGSDYPYDPAQLWPVSEWYGFSFASADGTELGPDETVALFNGEVTANGSLVSHFPFTLAQPGTYSFLRTEGLYGAEVHAINPGDCYDTTVLAEENGLDAKINAYYITAQSTVSYQGKEIPLYTVKPGSDDNLNVVLKETAGAAYVVNLYSTKNSGGMLTDMELLDTYEFTGREAPDGQNYLYGWWIDDEDPLLVFEIIENGTTIQSMALMTVNEVTPAQPEQPAAPAAGTYTVRQWDTWGQLALNNYGTYAAWPALRRANGNKPLSVGMTVTLPEKLGSYARLAPQVLAEGEKFYTVKAGDTLGQIAVTEYGSFMMYKDIFQRNSDRLKNVNSIYEGQILVLPAKK